MTNAHSLPDYKERYFETKTLDRIHGEPTLQKLIKLFRPLKRNAQKVPTRLGGGTHGYLDLLFTTPKYNNITGTTPFIRPTDPRIFAPTFITVPGTSTASTGVATRASTSTATITAPTTRPSNSAELAQQKARYDEDLCLYLEVQTVETLLRNKLLNAFDDDYIQALRDANDVINIDIPAIMDYLIKSYGQVKPEEYRALKAEVEEYTYDPLLPIDVLFNKLEFFLDLSDFVEKPMQDSEKVDIIYIILNCCGMFQDSLKLWNKKATADKTYANIKKFFRQEHLDLDKVNALAKRDLHLNHTEFMAQHTEFLGEMESRLKTNLADAITQFANAYETDTSPPDDKEDTATEMTSALSTITGNLNKQTKKMLKLVEGLCKKVDELSASHNNNNSGNGGDNKGNVNPRTGKPWRRYCWSHGCCNHWSNKCPHRKPGHKLNATIKNRMGGSTTGVLGA